MAMTKMEMLPLKDNHLPAKTLYHVILAVQEKHSIVISSGIREALRYQMGLHISCDFDFSRCYSLLFLHGLVFHKRLNWSFLR